MDVTNIIAGNHDAIIQNLLSFDSPEALATLFAEMRTMIVQHAELTNEVPVRLTQYDYALSQMSSFFFATAIAQNKMLVHTPT